MSNAEQKLAQLFAADVPPASDRAFAFAVLERIERRRAFTDMLEIIPYIIGAGALLWLLAPTIDHLVQQSVAVFNVPALFATIALLLTGYVFFNPAGRAAFDV
jgi:hypothetical protein